MMDAQELQRVLEAHALWLQDPAAAGTRRADLRGADFGYTVVIQSGPLGSRRDYLVTIRMPDSEEQTRTGCWVGSLDELEQRVQEVHGYSFHGWEYQAAIAYHRAMLAAKRKER